MCPCLQKERKQKEWIREQRLCWGFGYYKLVVWKHIAPVWKACQWCQGWEMLQCGFFAHAAGSSISGNISHSASLTPAVQLQYPHSFPSFHYSPLSSLPTGLLSALCPLLLPSPFLSTAPPFPLLPAHSLPPFPLFSTCYFLWFSNMPFHRMLPPVSLGGKGELLVFLF